MAGLPAGHVAQAVQECVMRDSGKEVALGVDKTHETTAEGRGRVFAELQPTSCKVEDTTEVQEPINKQKSNQAEPWPT